jgi:hypothetical protein
VAAFGLLYLLSLGFSGTPLTSVAILLLGRGLLGGAESFVIRRCSQPSRSAHRPAQEAVIRSALEPHFAGGNERLQIVLAAARPARK